MTKLMEWLLVSSVFFGIWTAAITGKFKSDVVEDWKNVIVPLPLILLFLFGVYSATVIIYRVFTFNDCEDAAKELQRQIEQAKAELRIKGVLSS